MPRLRRQRNRRLELEPHHLRFVGRVARPSLSVWAPPNVGRYLQEGRFRFGQPATEAPEYVSVPTPTVYKAGSAPVGNRFTPDAIRVQPPLSFAPMLSQNPAGSFGTGIRTAFPVYSHAQ